MSPRVAALIAYAMTVTRTPDAVTAETIHGLRAVGLSDAGIHDAAAVTAYFNFVNRLALGLGVELEEDLDAVPGR